MYIVTQVLFPGEDGRGWISLEQVLVRLNETYAPNGHFPVLSQKTMPDEDGNPTHIGYDALVCIQLFEPWIVEVYNSTTGAGPVSIKLVERGSEVRSVDTGKKGKVEKLTGLPMLIQEGNSVRRALNSTRLKDVYACFAVSRHVSNPLTFSICDRYEVAHTNGINQVVKVSSLYVVGATS
jgi:hypothetical protein